MSSIIPKVVGAILNLISVLWPKLAGRVIFNVFCYPYSPKLKPQQVDYLQRASVNTFISGDRTIQSYKWGHGPKNILLLHGWASHSYRWKDLIEALPNEDYTIYAFDAPGHGLSSGKTMHAELYRQAMEHFLASSPKMDYIISHSIGSFALLYALFKNPLLHQGPVLLMGTPQSVAFFMTEFQRQLGLTDKAIETVKPEIAVRIGKPYDYFTTRHFAPLIDNPALIIHDDQDLEVPYSFAVELHQDIKKATLVTTSGLGHKLRSPQVIQIILDYIS
jgi:hypothetical protein